MTLKNITRAVTNKESKKVYVSNKLKRKINLPRRKMKSYKMVLQNVPIYCSTVILKIKKIIWAYPFWVSILCKSNRITIWKNENNIRRTQSHSPRKFQFSAMEYVQGISQLRSNENILLKENKNIEYKTK